MQAAMAAHIYPHVPLDRSESRVMLAMDLAERAIFEDPGSDFTVRTRGNLKFWLLGDLEGAVGDCMRALTITANCQLAHLTLVQRDLFSSEPAAARDRFLARIEVDIALPQYPDFQSLLALFALAENDMEAARQHAREGREVAPWSDLCLLVLGCAHAQDPLPPAARARRETCALTADSLTALPTADPNLLRAFADRARAARS